MGRELLAWTQEPEPFGTAYFAADFGDADVLARLLDMAQVHRATITPAGWRFLLANRGVEGLLDLNRDGQWFDADDALATSEILHRARVAGFELCAMV